MWVVLSVVLVLTGAVHVSAQGQDSTSKKLAAIRDEMERGQALYAGGNYTAAAQIFELGYQAHPYSAFLFNAAVCYQRLGDTERALDRFREYLRVDAGAPDRAKVTTRIEALEAARAAAAEAAAASAAATPETDPAAPATPGVPAAEVNKPIGPTAQPLAAEDAPAMKSLVVIETEPQGAPLRIFTRVDGGAAPFHGGGANPGWTEVSTASSPANLTLDVGRYHVVVEKFRDFNQSEATIDVLPGHVHHFKANLSQGEFMAFLRVSGNVPGAYLYVNDPKKARAPWGTAPHGELVAAGEHTLLVEAPGFQPLLTRVKLAHGEQREMEVKLLRLGYGLLRVTANAPEIRVSVDERMRGRWRPGQSPLELQLPSGTHRLSIESDGRKTFEGTVDIPRGQVQPVHARLIPKYPRGAAWTEAVIGAAVVGTGVYLGLESNRLYGELERDQQRGVLERDDSRVSQGRWFSIGANVGFVIGGALAVLATYDFLKDPLPESSLRAGAPLEFDDRRKARPTASGIRPQLAHAAPARKYVRVGPSPQGIALGGRL